MSIDTFVENVSGRMDEPLYSGAGIPEPEEAGLPYSFDGRGYMIETTDSLTWTHRYQRTAVQLLNSQQAQTGGDQALVVPEVWRRSIESWHQGSAQDHYDRKDSLDFRYFDSQGINPWDQWQMSLLNEVENIHALAAGHALMCVVRPGILFVGIGAQGYWFTDITDPPISMTLPANIVDCCSDGQNLYTIDTTGHVVLYTDHGSSSALCTVASTDPTRPLLRSIKGFLVAAAGPKLWDITTGTPAAIYTHPNTGWWWRDACEGPGYAYLMGGVGARWACYHMKVKDDATTFDPPIQSAPLPDGEIGYSVGSYMNFVMLGTSGGWRFANPDTTGAVQFGRLIETPTPVRCFDGQDRFVWFGRGEPIGGERNSGLGRADLSVFIDTLTPAAAPDLECVANQGTVGQVVTYYPAGGGVGVKVFTIDGVGIFVEQQTKVPDGWLDQGGLTFNSSDQKMGLYAQVYHQPLQGSVGLDIAYDGGPWGEIAVSTQGGATDMGHAAIAHEFVTARLRYRLIRSVDSPTLGPILTRIEFRVLPVPGMASEWRIPLIIRERIEYQSIPQARDCQADFDWLLGIVQTRRPVTMREYGVRTQVYGVDYTWIQEAPTDDGEAAQGIFIIVVREVG